MSSSLSEAEKTRLLEDLREKVDKAEKSVVIEIDKSMVRRFAQAIEDPNPLWQDEEYAKRTGSGGILVPPEFFCTSMMSGGGCRPEVPLPYDRILDGGGDWEFLLPVEAGDTITSSSKLVELREKQGKSGKMLFLTFETLHKNQRNELVAKSRGVTINLE